MLRRNFFRWLSATLLPFLAPRFSRAQEMSLLPDLASVVLPSSLGRPRTDEIARKFVEWTHNYKADADAGYGYGFPHPQKLPANPAAHYDEQLRELETAAGSKGSTFTKLDVAAKREIVIAALTVAQVDRIPTRPAGKHVAADLLSFFYNSADGEDFLYNSAIKKDDCRGLETSLQRPTSLT